MAGPDFNIIKPELAGSFGAGYRASQENRMATEENQLKLDQLKADRQAMLQFQEQLKAAGRDPDVGKVFDAMIATGNPDYVMKGMDGKKRLQAQVEFAKMMGLDMPGAPMAAPEVAPGVAPANAMGGTPAPAAPANALAGGPVRPAASVAAPATPVNAMAPNQPMIAQTQTRINNLLSYAARNAGTPEGNQAIQQAKIMQDQLEMYNRQKSPSLADRYVPVGKHVFDRETQKWISAPGGGEGGAGPAPKPMTAVQAQKFKKDMAADVIGVQAAQSTADELEKLTDELVGNPDKNIKPHAGLGGITGWSALAPSAPSGNARKAEQKLDTFKGKVKAFGRQLASQEGKLGNMAVQEWKMVADAIQAIDPKAGNLDEQMRDVVRQARVAATRIKDKYDMTYEGQEASATNAPPVPKAESVTIGGKTYARPAGMSNADWAEYKASQGVK